MAKATEQENHQIIEHLLETGACKNIALHITTNGSVKKDG